LVSLSNITTLLQTRTSGIELTELVYADGLRLPHHVHEDAGFSLVLDGTHSEGYGARELVCRPHSVAFTPGGTEHTNVFAPRGSHCFTIVLSQPLMARLDGAPLVDPFEQQGGMLELLAQRLLAECRNADDVAPLAIEGLVLEMIAAAARTLRSSGDSKKTPAIRRVRELLEARFAEPLRLDDLAAAVGRHPVYVSASFRRAYGETISDFVRKLRVEHARRELARGALPIVEIALASGFANQSHFTRAFRKAHGVTPAAYRFLITGKRH
jgi:AraC family transcriptional regulator